MPNLFLAKNRETDHRLDKFELKKRCFLVIGSLSIFFILWLSLRLNVFPGQKELKNFLAESLVKSEPVPAEADAGPSDSNSVIYVLGGAPQSLEGRFKTASDLYKKGLAKKILIDSEQMKMAYSPALKRNLTRNEWAIGELLKLGVDEKNIELVPIQKGFFGTFAESQSISDFVLKKGYQRLILVSSRYHTMRVWECFSTFTRGTNLSLYIYPASDYPSLQTLLPEYLKLRVYQTFLL